MREIEITKEQKEKHRIDRIAILDNGKYIIWWKQGNPSGMEYTQDDLFYLLNKVKK